MEKKVKSALDQIYRGSSEIIGKEQIELLVKEYYSSGKRYKVKAGFDPTGSDLHLGHTVLLQKLRVFQEHGATIQLLIGDFTATIGDPTGKSETRKVLDNRTVEANAKSYTKQAFKIVDRDRCEVLFNSSWLQKLGASGLVELTTSYTVARMLERDDFEKRYKSGKSISISEFIYPLLQGYDSVELESDIELGGTDQKFNLLMGRHLQKTYGKDTQQAVMMMPILEGLDGVQKMSKSLNNYIGITDDANEMYAKIMSISDELMWRYYELLSNKSIDEIEKMRDEVKDGTLHPKSAKEILAKEMVQRFYDHKAAFVAKENFDTIFKSNRAPDDIQEVTIGAGEWICKVLVDTSLEPSTSQARRDIRQGAVRVDGQKVADERLTLDKVGTFVLQVGKRKFIKLKVIR